MSARVALVNRNVVLRDTRGTQNGQAAVARKPTLHPRREHACILRTEHTGDSVAIPAIIDVAPQLPGAPCRHSCHGISLQ